MALMLGKEKWDTLSALLHFYVTYIVGYNINFQARTGLKTKSFHFTDYSGVSTSSYHVSQRSSQQPLLRGM